MKSMAFQVGLAIFGGAALVIWGPFESSIGAKIPDLGALVDDLAETAVGVVAEPPVMVMLIEDQIAVNQIRDSIDPRRIVADTPEAFAVAEGRVFATSIDAAAGPINQAGWTDRSIEFVDPTGGDRMNVAEFQAQIDAKKAEAESALLSQDEFKAGDSMRVLREMERTGNY